MNPQTVRVAVIGLLVAAMAVALVRFAGLDGGRLAAMDMIGPGVVALLAVLIVLVVGVGRRRPQLGQIGQAVLFWGGLLVVLMLVYAFRGELAALWVSLGGPPP
jgi:hypothetical protein